MSFIKEYEKEIPSRPYRIYWHGRFLRSYVSLVDFKNGVKFYTGFLIAISGKVVAL